MIHFFKLFFFFLIPHRTMIENNIVNIVNSALKSLSLRAECLELDIRIIWEGNAILKTHKNTLKLIKINGQKLDYYNELQSQMGRCHKEIDNDLKYITRTVPKMNTSLFYQTQRHERIKKIVEDKFSHMCTLNNEIRATEEILVNRSGFDKCMILA